LLRFLSIIRARSFTGVALGKPAHPTPRAGLVQFVANQACKLHHRIVVGLSTQQRELFVELLLPVSINITAFHHVQIDRTYRSCAEGVLNNAEQGPTAFLRVAP